MTRSGAAFWGAEMRLVLPLVLVAGGAQAGVSCDFGQVCRHGQACEDRGLVVTLEPAAQGSSSRIVVNGVSTASLAVEFSAAGGVVRAQVFERAGEGVTVLVMEGGITHLLSYGAAGDAAYTVQSAEAQSVQSYFGTCEGRL